MRPFAQQQIYPAVAARICHERLVPSRLVRLGSTSSSPTLRNPPSSTLSCAKDVPPTLASGKQSSQQKRISASDSPATASYRPPCISLCPNLLNPPPHRRDVGQGRPARAPRCRGSASPPCARSRPERCPTAASRGRDDGREPRARADVGDAQRAGRGTGLRVQRRQRAQRAHDRLEHHCVARTDRRQVLSLALAQQLTRQPHRRAGTRHVQARPVSDVLLRRTGRCLRVLSHTLGAKGSRLPCFHLKRSFGNTRMSMFD